MTNDWTKTEWHNRRDIPNTEGLKIYVLLLPNGIAKVRRNTFNAETAVAIVAKDPKTGLHSLNDMSGTPIEFYRVIAWKHINQT